MPGAVSVSFTGGAAFDGGLDGVVSRLEHATPAAMIEFGRVVQMGAAARIHSRSGRLAASVHTDTPRPSGLAGYEAKIGPEGVVYAAKHELGKRGRYHAVGHPYFAPAVREALAAGERVFAARWSAAVV